jgi:hypothetical protein
MKRQGELSEAEQLLLAQSADLDPLFFDIEFPTEELFADDTGESPDRPQTRADCASGPRPCPWVTCRQHLYLDVRNDGVVKVNFPSGPDAMLATCALDLADDGPRTLDQVSVLMGMSRERVRQIEEQALVKLRFAIREGDLDYDGSELEAQDGAFVIEETEAKQDRVEAMQRRSAKLAAKAARREARQRAATEREQSRACTDLVLPQ